ncbi:MAG TPA: hypothetical protein VLB01_01140 [Thermodesulfobacteriota bacterium]|nr:hypothetical protein [Thermodesulfobacteriota bacterium]
MTKLFTVKSRVSKFIHRERVYDFVEFQWFVVYRETSTFSYDELIESYRNKLDNSYYISESNISELFTEEEADALKEYLLRTLNHECEIEEANLLIESYTLAYEDIILGHEEGFYRLNEEEGYDLPFIVWGYYDVSYAEDISWLEYGMKFIERALNRVGISVTSRDKLGSIVRELKDEGLFVDKGIKKKKGVKGNTPH